MEIKQTEEPKYLGELINSLTLQDHQKIINPHNHLAPNLHNNAIITGDGATWQKSVTLLNYLKGAFQCPFPPKSKGARSSTDPTQTDPITLKTMRRQYHNPDPITSLFGKVNEAHIVIDEVECLALMDS